MKISKQEFGVTTDGLKVNEFTITNKNNAKISFLDYGLAVTKIEVPDKNGNLVDVCLSYETLAEYEDNTPYFGVVCGRVANRIKDGHFSLNGETYNLLKNLEPNHLHGGVKGFNKQVWDSKILEDGVLFNRTSPHMEEGYPGNLTTFITYRFTDSNEFVLEYFAFSDKDTIVNMTNHAYFNLSGHQNGVVNDSLLTIFADEFLEHDKNGLPTGKILKVENTPFDFRKEKAIGQDIEKDDYNLKNVGGYDHTYALNKDEYLKKAAILRSEKTGITMETYTTEKGVQLYTGNNMTTMKGKNCNYERRYGLCLETQNFPDAINKDNFPSIVLKSGEIYKQLTIFKFL